mmetsp:Transcript_31375/g.47431  ORF Transcript_31375/g.47431 Transcript_31375/m.47431 type:complete len:240 (+) Transcript_31375:64-783(+)
MTSSLTNPGPFDVLCCKSSEAYDHEGNRNFRALVQSHGPTYVKITHSKILKSQVVNAIIRSIRSAGGNFLQRSTKCQDTWTVIKKSRIREKVGHALRRAVEKDRKYCGSPCSVMTEKKPQHFTLHSKISTQFNEFITRKGNSITDAEVDPFKPIECFPAALPDMIQSCDITGCSTFANPMPTIIQSSNDDDCIDFAKMLEQSLFDPFENAEPIEPLLIADSDEECDTEVATLLRELIET